MYCDGCGTQLQDGNRFCPKCGKPLLAGPPASPAATSRTAGHVTLLGILWLAMSALRMVPGIAIMAMSHSRFDFLPPDVPDFVPHLITALGFLFAAAALATAVIGWGLLNWQPWARMAAIVFGCLSLLDFPFGTALGIYTLWVLLPEQSGREYRARSVAGNAYPAV